MRLLAITSLLAACSSPSGTETPIDASAADSAKSPDAAMPDGPAVAGAPCPTGLTEVARIAGAQLVPDDRGFYGATYKQGLYTRDADGDGKADIVSVEYSSGTVGNYIYKIRVFLRTATGFAAPVSSTVNFPGYGPTSNAVGDFNGDHRLDVVFEWESESPSRHSYVYVALQNADHTFTLKPSVNLSACKSSSDERRFGFSILDVDRDGLDDLLATVSYQGLGAPAEGLTLLRGTATGLGSASCKSSATVSMPGFPAALGTADGFYTADFDQDGDLDLVSVSAQSQMQLYENTAASTFTAVAGTAVEPSWRVTFATKYGLVNADIKDDHTDLHRYRVSHVAGIGASEAAGTFAVPSRQYGNLRGVVASDFNGDGLVDVLAGGDPGTTASLMCDRTARWDPGSGALPQAAHHLRAIDFDGDGTSELLANEGTDAVIYAVH